VWIVLHLHLAHSVLLLKVNAQVEVNALTTDVSVKKELVVKNVKSLLVKTVILTEVSVLRTNATAELAMLEKTVTQCYLVLVTVPLAVCASRALAPVLLTSLVRLVKSPYFLPHLLMALHALSSVMATVSVTTDYVYVHLASVA